MKIRSYSRNINDSLGLDGISLSLFIVIVSLPIFAMVLQFLDFVKGQSKFESIENLFSFRKIGLLSNSILHTGLVSGLCILMGILIASYLWRIHDKPYTYLRWIFFVLAFIPPYIHLASWKNFFSSIILLNTGMLQIGIDRFLISDLVQFMLMLPFGTGIVLIGMETVNCELIEAGEIFKSDFNCFLKIVMPLVYPFIILGYGILFIINFICYNIPLFFGNDVYFSDIFTIFIKNNAISKAFLVAILVFIVFILTICFLLLYFRKDLVKNILRTKKWRKEFIWPNWFRYLQFIGVGILAFDILIEIIYLFI